VAWTAVVLGRDGGPFDSRTGRCYDAPVSATPRRLAPLVLVAAGLAACTSSVSPSPATSARATASAPAPSAAPATAKPTPAPTLPSTTNTPFGRIWDALPKDFPTVPGQTPTELATPASGTFVVNGTAKTLAGTFRKLLTAAGWTADVGSPLEDGSVVLEAAGRPDGCKAEVRFTPLSGTVVVTVLYGATCPFS
jgi:hypothetical protein